MRKNIAIVVMGATVGLLVAVLPEAVQASPVPWQTTTAPAGVGGQQSVSCWAAGGCLSVGGGQAMEWNGSTWTAVPAPANSDVEGVSCLSSRRCVAVGNTAQNGAAAWSWNGRTWTSQSAYRPPGFPGAGLSAVTCVSVTRCEAVGSTGNAGCSGNCGPLAEVWNGMSWSDQPISGAPSSDDAWLAGVTCASAHMCEAVGGSPAYTCTVGICVIPPVAWAAGLSGGRWVTQPSMTALYPDAADAESVSCWAASHCTAVGREGSAVGPDNPGCTFAARWNGSTWTTQGSIGSGQPSGVYFADWAGVHCQSASRCTAAGAYEPNYAGPESALVSSWNGKAWSQVSAPPGGDNSYLAGLACAHGGPVCTAVGGESGLALAERN